MKSITEVDTMHEILNSGLSIESQVNVLYEIVKNVLDEGALRARTIRFKLQKKVKSNNPYERLFALSKIITEGKGLKSIPDENNIDTVLKEVCIMVSDLIAKRYVETQIERQVEQSLIEKQEKYVEEIKLGIMKKQKGPETVE